MSQASEQPWWREGTLHDKTMQDWFEATPANQMATCLDMIMAMKEDMDTHIVYATGEELMRYVVELMSCMTAAAIEHPEQAQIKVAELALTSAEALGYLHQDETSSTPL